MTFLSPLALALSVLAAPIILMYILKLRRQPKLVSSTFLWRKALDDVQANAPWQRLRMSLLLILQLLALLALVIVLAQPAYSQTERFSGDLILIVDQSYGMQALDGNHSRFAVAQSEANTLANSVGSGDVVSVIGMGAQPTLAIAESSDRGAVSRAIDGLRPGVSTPDFLETMSLAASLARGGQTTRAVVLTSRQSGIASLPVQVPFAVEIWRIGSHLRDLGISTFSASLGHGKVDALARISNFGGSTEASDLNLYADGQLADVRPVTVNGGAETTLFWNDLPASTHTLRVQLTRHDDVSTDKQAWSVVQAQSTTRVLLVTSGDYFLETALTLNSGIRLSVISPASYKNSLAQKYDLVVFDGNLPSSLPITPTLLLSPPAGAVGPISFGRFLAAGAVTPSTALPAQESSIVQYVDVSDVQVGRMRAARFPGWMSPIFLSNGNTLVAAGGNNGERVAATTFSLQESNWPIRISFPILMQNFLRFLVPGIGIGSSDLSAGQTLTLTPAPGVRQVNIVRPDGVTDHIAAPFPPFTDTTVPGIYTITQAGRRGSTHFAVNFLPARPAPTGGPAKVLLGASHGGASKSSTVPESLSWVVVLAGLSLLTAEWWFAFKR